MKRNRLLTKLAAALAFLVAPAAVDAQTAPQSTNPASPPATPTLTSADLSAFFDGIIPQQLDRENVAGATVSVVKDGKILFGW